MKKNLIIPIAGKSSRFPGLRPKWMLTHPSGNFMVIKAISGLDLDSFDHIYFTYLKEHQENFKFRFSFEKEITDLGIKNKTHYIELETETKNQPETVYLTILKAGIKGSIMIKDSDNYFKTSINDGNFVCVYDLNNSGLINPSNKSYAIINDDQSIVNIIEKKVISPYFCVGGYGFEDAQLFCNLFEQFEQNSELYISNLIYEGLLKGSTFKSETVTDYRDWGTLKDWDYYKRSYATLFIDFDGVIVQNAASHFPPYYGETEGIKENIAILKTLKDSGKFEIIITTSRKEEFRDVTIKQLNEIGLKYDTIIMGLQHSKRIIINDYAISNPFKSCDAINLKRNSTDLREILKESLGIDYSDI